MPRGALSEPSVLALGGSWLAPKSLIAQGDWTAITRLAQEANGIVRQSPPMSQATIH